MTGNLPPWEEKPSSSPPASPAPWEQPAAPPPDRAPDPEVAKFVKNAPGMTEAKSPLDALVAGWQQSDLGLIIRGKPPDMGLAKNASFAQKLADGIGSGAGDLPFSIAGGIGGASAGAAAGTAAASETGPGAAVGAGIGAAVGGGAGAFALPEAVRQTLMDYYRKDNIRSSSDFIRTVSHSAWEVGKATFEGAVAGPAAAVGGKILAPVAKSLAPVGEAAGFVTGATAAQSALEGKMPDPEDTAAAAVTMLGLHAAGVTLSGGFKPTDAAGALMDHSSQLYRQTGIPPWDQTRMARNDPVLKQEMLSRDINGQIIAPKFNAMRPEEPEPFKTNPMAIRDEHEQEVQGLTGQAFHRAAADRLQPIIRQLEGSGDEAVSPAGAIGRYQVMPATAAQYGFDPSRLFEPGYNQKVSHAIISDLVRRFHGDQEAVLIAYNAGPGRAWRFLRNGRDPSVLPKETQHYLSRGQALVGAGGKPLEQLPKEPATEKGIEFSGLSTDERVARVAGLSGMPEGRSQKPTMFGLEMELDAARRMDNRLRYAGLLDPMREMSMENAMRQTYGTSSRMLIALSRGPVVYTPGKGGQFGTYSLGKGPSYEDVVNKIGEIDGTEAGFDTYRISKRTIQKDEQGIDLGVLPGGVEEAKTNVADPNLKKYEPIDRLMQQWKNSGLAYAVAGGRIKPEQAKAMQEANLSHVSINRLMGDEQVFQTPKGSGSILKTRNPFHLMEGGKKGMIVRPLLADGLNMQRMMQETDRNIAREHVLSNPDFMKFFGISLEKAGKKAVETDLPLTDKEKEAYEPFLAAAEDKKLSDLQFTHWRNGEKYTGTTSDPDIARLLRGLETRGEANWLLKVASIPATLKRSGIAVDPSFGMSVTSKHALTAAAFSPHHPPPVVTQLRGILDAFGHGDAFWEFAVNGGLDSTIADMDRNLNGRVLQTLDKTGVFKRGWNVTYNPVQWAQWWTSSLSNASRIGEFKMLRERGMAPAKAAMEARKDFLDFQEPFVSNMATMMAKTMPFFKARVLGIKQGAQGARFDPVKTAMWLGGIALAQAGLYVANRRQDKGLEPRDQYASLPQYQKDNYLTTPEVGGFRFRLGMPFNYAPTAGLLLNRYLEYAYDKNPNAFDGILSDLGTGEIQPFSIPPFALPELETFANRQFSNGAPLIPERLRHVAPDLQVTDYTSKAATDLAKVLGNHGGLNIAEVSPVVADQYVRDWFGTAGNLALKALDVPLGGDNWPTVYDLPFVKSFFTRQTGMNSSEISDFYTAADKIEEANATLRNELKSGTLTADDLTKQPEYDAALKLREIGNIKHALAVQRTLLSAINKNETMDTDEKRQLTDRIVNDAIMTARFGNRIAGGGNPEDKEFTAFQEKLGGDIEQTAQKLGLLQ